MKALFLLAACLFLTACPGKKPESKRKLIFVHGDPMEFVEGSTLNTKLDLDYFNRSQHLFIFTGVEFRNQSEYVKNIGHRDLEAENKASESNEEASLSAATYKVEVAENQIQLIGDEGYLVIQFDEEQNATKVLDYEPNGEPSNDNIDFKLLHVSNDQSGYLMSLLFHASGPGYTSIMAVHFTNNMSLNLGEKTDAPYYYATGKGVKTAFDKNEPIRLSICGASQKLEPQIQDAMKEWQRALEGLAEIQLESTNDYAPFSDYNQNCIYTLDTYIREADPNASNYGMAIPMPNPNTGQLADGDIFLLEKEFEKSGFSMLSDQLSSRLKRTLIHEMGHYLGLDHQFDGVKSIMSYDFSHTDLGRYDYRAIQELYK